MAQTQQSYNFALIYHYETERIVVHCNECTQMFVWDSAYTDGKTLYDVLDAHVRAKHRKGAD